MTIKKDQNKVLLFILTAMLIVLLSIPVEAKSLKTNFTNDERHYLVNLYHEKGFDISFLKSIFFDQKLRKFPIVVSKNVHNKEVRRNYLQFYSPYSFKLANRFLRKWRTVLKNASSEFDVEQEIVVAILLVETGLGNVLGKYPVISVFSSILVEKEKRSELYASKEQLTPEMEYEIDRLELKSEWALEELSALLQISQQNDQSPFKLRGSFAGAFGIPQFLPSSYLKWGVDSDNNGTVNLFLVPDAVYSTANYLKAHGWKKGLYRESNKDVIYKYNKSEIYVETVLDIAKKIKASQQPNTASTSKQTRLKRPYKNGFEKSSS